MMTDDNNGLGYDCPDSVLITGKWRVGTHQSNNLYVVEDDGTEYYVGALFRPHYGPTVTGLLNLVHVVVAGVKCEASLRTESNGMARCELNRWIGR